MLTLPGGVRIYACTAPCDMRKQIDGLAALVQHGLGYDAQSGHLFMAFNRRGVHGAHLVLGQERLRSGEQALGGWHFRAAVAEHAGAELFRARCRAARAHSRRRRGAWLYVRRTQSTVAFATACATNVLK
jgi:transposase